MAGAHAMQDPIKEKYPALHWQDSAEVLPAGATVCCGHGSQVCAVAALYLEAGHCTQLAAAVPE